MMQWYSPWAALLLLLIPLMVWLVRRRKAHARLPFASLRDLQGSGIPWRVRFRFLLLVARLLCVLLLIAAIARPRQGSKHHRVSTKGVVMEIVVDRSSSMDTPMGYDNQQSTRFEVVKKVLADFVAGGKGLEGRPDDLLGLIAFARYADTLCPLVHAHDALLGFLKETDTVKVRAEDGTAIGDALALAVARLETAAQDITRRNQLLAAEQADTDDGPVKPEFEIQSKAILLLTDGINNVGDHLPLESAQWAQDKGIKIYTIGIGGDQQYVEMQGLFGVQRIPAGQQLDERLLKAIAEGTGGFYARADDAESLRAICEKINQLEKTEIESVEYSQYAERFGPPALGALMALMAEIFLTCTIFRKIP